MHMMRCFAIACAALLSTTPGMAQTPLERGEAGVEAERFQEAIAILNQGLDGRQLKSVADIGLAYWHRGRAKAIFGAVRKRLKVGIRAWTVDLRKVA